MAIGAREADGFWYWLGPENQPGTKKPPATKWSRVFGNKCLTVSYSHMGKPHTTIGAELLHFRVRDGIGWFKLAMAARQTGRWADKINPPDSNIAEENWALHVTSNFLVTSCLPYSPNYLGVIWSSLTGN